MTTALHNWKYGWLTRLEDSFNHLQWWHPKVSSNDLNQSQVNNKDCKIDQEMAASYWQFASSRAILKHTRLGCKSVLSASCVARHEWVCKLNFLYVVYLAIFQSTHWSLVKLFSAVLDLVCPVAEVIFLSCLSTYSYVHPYCHISRWDTKT